MLAMPGGGSAGDEPGWHLPPPMIGGHVAGPVVISQDDRLVVAVRHVVAYPNGLEVEVEAHARKSSPGGLLAGLVGFTGHPQLRFRLRLADGTDVAQDDEAGLQSGRGPMLTSFRSEMASGASAHGEDVRQALWIWPLPSGPVTVSCSWPQQGLQHASLVLDGEAIRVAALQARPFWQQGS